MKANKALKRLAKVEALISGFVGAIEPQRTVKKKRG